MGVTISHYLFIYYYLGSQHFKEFINSKIVGTSISKNDETIYHIKNLISVEDLLF